MLPMDRFYLTNSYYTCEISLSYKARLNLFSFNN